MFEKFFQDMQNLVKPYQDSLANAKQFEPISNLMVIQAKALEKLGAEQTRFYTESIEALTKQAEANSKNPTDAAKLQEAQFNFAQDMQNRVGRLFKTNMDIVAEARKEATAEVETLKAAVKPAAKAKA